MTKMQNRSIRFLLVEDDDDHADLIQRAIATAEVEIAVDRVCDGEAALAFLSRDGEYADARRPDVVLLDINLPKVDGHQVLRHIKKANMLASIPVIMLTTSQSELDRDRAFTNEADSYVSKPTSASEFEQLVAHLSSFWATMGAV